MDSTLVLDIADCLDVWANVGYEVLFGGIAVIFVALPIGITWSLSDIIDLVTESRKKESPQKQ